MPAANLADLKKENQRLRRENARLHRMALEYRALISGAEHLGWCRGRQPDNDFEASLRRELWRKIETIDEEVDALRKSPETGVLLLRSEYETFAQRLSEMNVQALFTQVEDEPRD